MQRKVSLPELAASMALKASLPLDRCEIYLREFAAIVSETLSDGETLRIKGFGTFKLIQIEARKSVSVATGEEVEIPKHNKVVFIPAKELAEEVNMPFQAFEAVEIPEGTIETDILAEDVSTDEPEISSEEENNGFEEDSAPDTDSPSSVSRAQLEIEENDFIFTEHEDALSNAGGADNMKVLSCSQEVKDDSCPALSPEAVPIAAESVACPEPVSSSYPVRRHRFLKEFLWGMATGIIASMAGAWASLAVIEWQLSRSAEPAVAVVDVSPVPVATVSDEPAQSVDSLDVPTRPSVGEEATMKPEDPVYDTVTKTRYLTTMAKDHYGNYHLWPYIYEENKAILGHPDRIRPGTRVRIPSLEKYGVDPSNPADISAAKRKGGQIYSRYR